MKFTKLAPGAVTSTGVTIQPRLFKVKGYDDVPLLWMGDSIWFTQLFNALSILIPEAERFMIKAIRNAMELTDDHALKDECRAFIIQEAHHHKIHDQLNAVLEKHNIGVTAICPGVINTPIVANTQVETDTDNADQFINKAVKMYNRRNYPPSKVAKAIIKAVEANSGVKPVSPEAWFMYYTKRLTPNLWPVLGKLNKTGL